MKKITLLSLFIVALFNVNAAELEIFGFQESPIYKRTCSAGVCTFTKANPVKTGLNLTDSCGVMYRSTTGNTYAAPVVYFTNPTDPLLYRQIDTVRVAADETKYFHLLIYNFSSKNITPKIFISTGATSTGDLVAQNLTDGILTANNQWVDLVYTVNGGTTGFKLVNVQLRLDNTRQFVASNALGNNLVLPPTTVIPEAIGTDYLYFDEFIMNDDPNPRSLNSAVKETKSDKQFEAYVDGRKIMINSVLNDTKAVVYNIMGQKLSEKMFSYKCELLVPKEGVYMIQINGSTSKVFVK